MIDAMHISSREKVNRVDIILDFRCVQGMAMGKDGSGRSSKSMVSNQIVDYWSMVGNFMGVMGITHISSREKVNRVDIILDFRCVQGMAMGKDGSGRSSKSMVSNQIVDYWSMVGNFMGVMGITHISSREKVNRVDIILDFRCVQGMAMGKERICRSSKSSRVVHN